MTHRLLAVLGATLLAGSVPACADLPYLEPGTCGDRVVEREAGEDCDLLADPALGDDLVCGPPDGSAQQCRYVCDGAECPIGWKCEDDGICRAASGSFSVPDDPLTLLAADEVLLADLVEDERDELVARSGGELTILSDEDEGYMRVAELALEHVRSALSASDVDGDDFADLLVVSASAPDVDAATLGVHVLRSDGERLTSTVVPQTALDAIGGGRPDVGRGHGAARVRPGPDSAAEVVVLLAEREGQLVAFAPEPSCASLPDSASVVVGPVGDRAVMPTSRDATATSPATLALPVEGSASVSVVTWTRTCDADACPASGVTARPCVTTPGAIETIALPAAVVAPGCGFWDANADGERDLVCNVEDDEVVLVPATDGAFGTAIPIPGIEGRKDLAAGQSRACRSDHAVLAAGDLDGDGRLDVVTPHGVFASVEGGMERRYARVKGDAWTEAVMADFDGDGVPEVVASIATAAQSCEATEVERLVPTLGSYNARVVSGSNLPRALRTGDFDGDGLADLALVQRAEDGDVRVAVFYGDVKEALEDPARTGSFGSIDALVPARSRVGATPNEELVEDLAILSDGGEQWTLVTGSPGRSLLAPLPLAIEDGPSVGTSHASVLAGPLLPRASSDDALPHDLMAFAPGHVWLFRDEDVHHGDAPVHWTADELPEALAGLRGQCTIWTYHADDADGGATLAAIDGATPCDLDGPAPGVVVVTLSGARDQPTLSAIPLAIPFGLRRPVSLHLFHLGVPDDAPDLVVLGSGADAPTGMLVLMSEAGVTEHRLLPERDVIAVAPINADRDRDLELAAFTDEGLVIIDQPPGTEGGDDLETSEPRAPLPVPRTPGQVARLVAGEADGDGLDDLALLVGQSLYVYPSEGED